MSEQDWRRRAEALESLLLQQIVIALLPEAQVYWAQNPSQRYGQAVFNHAVQKLGTAVVEPLRGTDVDPFYDDTKVSAFLRALAKMAIDELVSEEMGGEG